MSEIAAYCGIQCTHCDAYLATQSDDKDKLNRVAAKWREEFGDPTLTAESIGCFGCKRDQGPLCSYCATCEIRACARDRSIESCAYCDDYGCDKLESFLSHAPSLRQTLDAMRSTRISRT